MLGQFSFKEADTPHHPLRIGKFGEPSLSLYERFYPIDCRIVSFKNAIRISSEFEELYSKGWSLQDIAREHGCSKNKIRSSLEKSGLERRGKVAQATHCRKVSSGKQGAIPYFGFCYFEGGIIRDPREFPTLQLIFHRWKDRKTIHHITLELNRAKIPSRKGREWSWAAVQNIVTRFKENKVVIHKGGNYEFR